MSKLEVVVWDLVFFCLYPQHPQFAKIKQFPRITSWWFIPAIIHCSTKRCFLVYGTLAHSGGNASGSLSIEFSTGLTLKSCWWELASTGIRTAWMRREILLLSDNVFRGDRLAFCTHYLQQRRSGQKPTAFMKSDYVMFPSQRHSVTERSLQPQGRRGERSQGSKPLSELSTDNRRALSCYPAHTSIELLDAYHRIMLLLIAFSYPEGMKALLACFGSERHPSRLLVEAVVSVFIRPINLSKSMA